MLLQALEDLGLAGAAEALQRETGVPVEPPLVAQFRAAVLHGQWAPAEDALDEGVRSGALRLSPPKEENLAYVRRLLLEQQYYELLELKDVKAALAVLRERMVPIAAPDEVQRLGRLVLCLTPQELYERAQWDGAAGTSRERLMRMIERVVDPDAMVPSHRLLHLLAQATAFQRLQDVHYFERALDARPSLLHDHAPDAAPFPRHNTHVLRGHTDQVWAVRFSHDGRRLASAGKDHTVIVWDAEDDFAMRLRLMHPEPVTSIDWSQDDQMLLVASEEDVTVWHISERLGCEYAEHQRTVSTVRWLPPTAPHAPAAEQDFVSGAMDQTLLFWHQDGGVYSRICTAPFRVGALDVSADGQSLVALGGLGMAPPPAAGISRDLNGFSARRTPRAMLRGASGATLSALMGFGSGDGSDSPERGHAPSRPSRGEPYLGTRPGASRPLPASSAAGEEEPDAFLYRLPEEMTSDAATQWRSRREPPGSAEIAEHNESPGAPAPDAGARGEDRRADDERNVILIYDLRQRRETARIYVKDTLNHVSIAPDSRLALLSRSGGEIQLWDLERRCIVQHYSGHRSDEFVIRAAFGGPAGELGPSFVLSGSEDSMVYVWHRATGRLIETLRGHTHGAVNDVAWCPSTHTSLVASCGDDGTVRIWQATPPDGPAREHSADARPTPAGTVLLRASSRSGQYASTQRATARTDEEAGDTHEDDTEEDEEEDDEEEDGDEEAHTQRDARPSEARDGTPSGESAQDGAASHPASARPSRPVVLPRASACPNPLPW